jgi:hypothetical protein
VRLSRHCYDKPHRCPGWAGGGAKYPKGESRCNNGHIQIDYSNWWTRDWTFHRCDKCDVVCWPIVVRELDWHWWRWRLHDWKYWWNDRLYDAQYRVVAGLENLCGRLDRIPILQRDERGKWIWVSSCWGCWPLRLATLSDKLDQRWKTRVWTPVTEEGRKDREHSVY